MLIRAIPLFLIAMLFAGCQNLQTINDTKSRIADAQTAIDQVKAKTEDVSSANAPLAALEHEDGAWLSRRSVTMEETDTVPTSFFQPAGFTSGRPLPLPLVLEKISANHNIVIHINGDVLRPLRSDKNPHAAGDTTDGETVQLNYSGTLQGLLDALAQRTGTYWTYREGAVQFARYKTRTFQIATMPGTSNFSASVGTQASGNGDSGSSGGKAAMTLGSTGSSSIGMQTSLSFWQEALATIHSMLSPAGKASMSAATNSITVTDTDAIVTRVRRFVDHENAVLGRQVSLQVKVFSVKLKRESQSGIDWNVAFKAAGIEAGFGLGEMAKDAISAPGIMAQIGKSSPWRDSRLIIKALQSQGDVSTVIDTSVVTLNNQPAPVAVTNNLTYLAKISRSVTGAGTTAENVYTAEPGSLTTGFVMNLMPTLLDNRSVMLQVQLSLSSLKSKETAQVGNAGSGGSITIPETSAIQTLQRASLKSGDSLLLTGFRRDDNNVKRRGAFDLVTGFTEAVKETEEFVIVITPQLVEGV